LSLLSQGPIDVQSSRPPVKEDEVDRNKRRQSAEKQKSTKDSEKKKEKTKNLDRQALDARRAKSRQMGEPKEESPSEDDSGDGDDDSDDSEGMASRLDQILEGPPRGDVDTPRTGAPKEGPSGSHCSRAGTPPAPAQSRAVPHPQPPPAPKAGDRAKPQATGPLTRGRAAAFGKGKPATGALALALARWEMLNQGLRPLVTGLEPRRGVVRGLPVEAPAGGPFSLWGKVFDAVILILLFLCVFSRNGLLSSG